MTPKNVLFLCTGNYYRSRFAELVFNHLATQRDLDWQANSRGLAPELGIRNVGPISRRALAGLAARGIVPDLYARYPLALSESDLSQAHHVVAVNRDEHLPILQGRFPHWVERVEFWYVHDLDFALAEEALGQLECNVRVLIDRLGLASKPYPPRFGLKSCLDTVKQ